MKKPVPPRAFSLVEVTLAIGIAAFCLLGIFTLLPVGATSNRDSVNTTHAASLAETVIADLRGTELGGTSLIYSLKPDTAGETALYLKEDGTKVPAAADANYRVAVVVVPPSSGVIAPTQVRAVFSWPAAAPNPANSFEVVSSLDRN